MGWFKVMAMNPTAPPWSDDSSAKQETERIPVAVYRALDADGQTLYIGATDNIESRKDHHRQFADWFEQAVDFDIQWYETREQALTAESAAICAYDPAFNHRTGSYHDRALCSGPRCTRIKRELQYWRGLAPTPPRAGRPVPVRFTDAELAAIDAEARRDGFTKINGDPNRSAMIRKLLAEALEQRKLTTGE